MSDLPEGAIQPTVAAPSVEWADITPRSEAPPDTLYHYTSVACVRSILSTRELHATSAQYVSDSSELKVAMEVARALLEKEAATQPIEAVQRGLSGFAQRLTHELLDRDPDLLEQNTVCAFSLSAAGDLLSQWQGYCPREGGYAIGFCGAELAKCLDQKKWGLHRCRYTRAEHEDILAPLIALIAQEAAGPNLLESFWPHFLRLAPLIKHEAFEREREWRVVSNTKLTLGKLDFRATGSLLVPYATIGLPPIGSVLLPVVRVGPHPHQELAIASVKGFLKRLGTMTVVQESTIPYRVFFP